MENMKVSQMEKKDVLYWFVDLNGIAILATPISFVEQYGDCAVEVDQSYSDIAFVFCIC